MKMEIGYESSREKIDDQDHLDSSCSVEKQSKDQKISYASLLSDLLNKIGNQAPLLEKQSPQASNKDKPITHDDSKKSDPNYKSAYYLPTRLLTEVDEP